jgi:hypothetical protein
MKNVLLFALTTFLFCSNAFSITYTTINNGNWNNATNVWSLNGVAPCNCFPNPTINGETIIVKHNINNTADLTISNNGAISILIGGKLINNTFNLNVISGTVTSQGTLSVKELFIDVLGSVYLSASLLNIQSKMIIDGSMTANFSNMYVLLGNTTVGATGSFILENNSKFYVTTGNFTNFGLVDLAINCCLQFNAGNIKNEIGGTFTGDGAVISDVGNIKNLGTWDSTLKWCASGICLGMTAPEDCAGANVNCGFAPLPTELVSFDIVQLDNKNSINWYTLSELNGDFYTLERSIDGINWETLTHQDVLNSGGSGTHYLHTDNSPLMGVSYYKLKLISLDGKDLFTSILGINSKNSCNAIVFPNPTKDFISIQFPKVLAIVNISIIDVAGKIYDVYEGREISQFQLNLPYLSGIYFVSIASESYNETLKVIKN